MKKSIIAITLVFALVAGFASCKKLEGDYVLSSKAYIVDDQGVTRAVYIADRDDIEGEGSEELPNDGKENNAGTKKRAANRGKNKKEYFYYDDEGKKVTVRAKDVIVEKTRVRVDGTTSPFSNISPEAQSFFAAYDDPEEIANLYEQNVTEPKLAISDDPIPEDNFRRVEVEIGADGKPAREEVKNRYTNIVESGKFTVDIVVKGSVEGKETVVPIYAVKDGDNAYFDAAVPVENKGSMRFNFIIADGKCYLVIPAMKAYMEIPKESMAEILPGEEIIANELDMKYDSSGEVEFNGKKYICDVYTVDGNTVKYYFAGDELKRVETISADDSTIIEVNSIKPTADESKFRVPRGFIDMTKIIDENFQLSEFY